MAAYRELAAGQPDVFRADLARALTNQAGRLADLGRREEALAAIGEAVAATGSWPRPGRMCSGTTWRGRWATWPSLADLGRPEEALAAIEEAVAAYRELAAAQPDAFRPSLAMSLNNRRNRLADLGRREEALAAIEEAVGRLTGSWPRPIRTRSGPTSEVAE